MKFSKLFPRVLLLVIAAMFVLAACAPQAFQGAVSLPEWQKAAIAGLISWFVAIVITKIILLAPFLKGIVEFQEAIQLILANLFINLIETNTPDLFGPIVIASITLVLAVLAYFKIGEGLKAKRVKLFM